MPPIGGGLNVTRRKAKRKRVLYAPQIKARTAAPRNADTGDRARSRPAPRVLYAPQIKARRRPKPRRVPPRAPVSPDRAAGQPTSREIERYKSSRSYTEALAKARLSGQIHRELQRRPALATPEKTGPIWKRRTVVAADTAGKSLNELARIADVLHKGRNKKPIDVRFDLARSKQEQAQINPAALKVLEFMQRTNYASAHAASAALKGKNPAKAAVKGLKGKRKTYSDVLKQVGAPKAVQHVVGPVLDIGLDPTTYATLGRSSAAQAAAKSAAKKAAKNAARAEATRVAASRAAQGFGSRTARKAGKRAGQRAKAKTREDVYNRTLAAQGEKAKGQRGVELRIAGRRVGGRHQVRATGAAEQLARRGARRVTDTKGGRVLRVDPARRLRYREVASSLNASVRPPGMTQDQWIRSRQIRREGRATAAVGSRQARQRAGSIRALTRPEEHRGFLDAIESGDLSALKGAAPVKLKRRAAVRGRKRIKADLAHHPDRLAKLAAHFHGDMGAMRQALEDVGYDIGKLPRTPGAVPEITADVAAKRSTLSTARSTRARAEREALDQLRPGMKPGGLTKAQKTRANRELSRAVQAKRGHLTEFTRVQRQASAASSPVVERKLRARASLVRVRARAAQDAIDHWTAVLQKREIPDKKLVDVIETKPQIPSRDEFLSKQTIVSDWHAPELEKTTQHLEPTGRPGVSIESKRLIVRTRGSSETRLGKEIPGEKVAVFRDADGKPVGVLDMLLDENGKTTIAEVVVDPRHRGQGISERLYNAAEKAGLEVHAASGREGYTQAGAAAAYRRLVNREREKAKAKAAILAVKRGPAPKRGVVKAAKKSEREALKTLQSERGLLRSETTARKQAIRRNADIAGEAKGYVPRILAERVEQRGPLTLEDVVGAVRQPGKKVPQAAKRKQRAPLATLRTGSKDDRQYAAQFTEDPALQYEAYMGSGARGLSHAQMAHDLFAEGRPITPGRQIALGEGERVYARDGAKLRELDHRHADREEVGAIEKGTASGEYVVLPKAMHDFVTSPEALNMSTAGEAWTAAWNSWKRVALATPSYLVRNIIGDTFNAMGAQDPARLAKNYFRGQRALNARARADRGYRWFEDAASRQTGKKTITVNGKEFSYGQLAALAEATGAIEAGRLADIADTFAHRAGIKPKGTSSYMALRERVENSARMGTFIGGLEKGMTPEKAADLVRDIHFDYGELTKAERKLRNYVAPFYTFTARNVPLQAKLLATRPGLPLAYEKVREEGQKAAGLDDEFIQGLDPYEANQLGIPVKMGKQVYTASVGAPISDLNVLTPNDPGDPLSWLTSPAVKLGKKGLELAGPFKVVGELLTNHSLFYGEPIKPDPRSGQPNATPVHPAVRALADALGDPFKKKFGITEIKDKRTGKPVMVWGREKAHALAAMLPGPYGVVYRGTMDKTNRRGFTPATEILGAAGVRAKPYDPAQAEMNRLNTELEEKVLPALNILHAQWKNKTTAPDDPALKRLTERESQIEKRLDELKSGWKFTKGRPNRPAGKSGGFGGSTGFGGGGGGFGGSTGF
jgi:GNAT superfamily N-acetyltransferase